jgi:cell division protein ZapA
LTKTIEVEIFGQRFPINGDADESYVHGLAQLVDKHMKHIAQGTKSITPYKLAVLAAINIAHELFESEKKRQQDEADVERRMVTLMQSIEDQIPSSVR